MNNAVDVLVLKRIWNRMRKDHTGTRPERL